MSEEKKKALWVDENTHMEVAIMAARRKTSIGKTMRNLIEAEKRRNAEKERNDV